MFSFITNYLELVASLLYLIVITIQYRQKNVKTKLLPGNYLATSTLLILGTFKILGKDSNNIWVYELIALFTSVFIGSYFYYILPASKKRKLVLLLTSTHLIYFIVRNLTLEGERLFDSIGFSIVSASIVIYVFMYFHQALKNVTETSILKEFNFWLASGYLFYYAGSFIIFVSYYYLTKKIIHTYTKEERDLLTALWGMHNVLLFVSALSLLIGCVWINYRRKSALL